MKLLVFLVGFLNIVSFAWSVFGVFRKEKERQEKDYFLLVTVSLLTYASVLASIWLKNEPPLWLSSVCSVLLLASLFLFWITANTTKKKKLSIVFSQDEPQFLVKEGPYKVLRHPFYFSYLLCYLAAILYNPTWYLIMSFLAISLIYFRAINHEEKKFAESPLADEYKEYCEKVGGLLPRWQKLF